MSRRHYGQMGFADHLVRKRAGKRVDRLERIEALLDWRALDQLLDPLSASRRGAPGYPPLSLFKALLLAQWYNLSDPGLEDALADRLSFRKFTGIPLDEETPDETTFVRFRERLREHNLAQELFDEVNRQLEGKGLVVKKGTLVDASVIEADAKRPSMKEGDVSKVDPDATFTKKHGKTYFGYKMHIGVDQGSGLIRRLLTTTAALHDSLAFRGLICGGEAAVYGDKAYGSEAHREWLAEIAVADRLMYKASRGAPLRSWQVWFNKAVAGTRRQVEQVFGIFKRSWGLSRARYRGEARNATHFLILATAWNLRRSLSLA